ASSPHAPPSDPTPTYSLSLHDALPICRSINLISPSYPYMFIRLSSLFQLNLVNHRRLTKDPSYLNYIENCPHSILATVITSHLYTFRFDHGLAPLQHHYQIILFVPQYHLLLAI